MRAVDREETRERLERDVQKVWGGKEKTCAKVFNLVGVSAEHVKGMVSCVSQEKTSVEARIALKL